MLSAEEKNKRRGKKRIKELKSDEKKSFAMEERYQLTKNRAEQRRSTAEGKQEEMHELIKKLKLFVIRFATTTWMTRLT